MVVFYFVQKVRSELIFNVKLHTTQSAVFFFSVILPLKKLPFPCVSSDQVEILWLHTLRTYDNVIKDSEENSKNCQRNYDFSQGRYKQSKILICIRYLTLQKHQLKYNYFFKKIWKEKSYDVPLFHLLLLSLT